MKAIMAAALVATLSGCSSISSGDQYVTDSQLCEPTSDMVNQPLVAAPIRELSPRYDRVNRNLTVSWDNIGRGGAAMLQPAYVHTLGGGLPVYANPSPRTSSPRAGHNPIPLPPISNLPTKKAGYSMYELARWKRYCDGGKTMDKADWAFVRAQGPENVPIAILGSCNPPSGR